MQKTYLLTDFLPTTKKELELRGWDEVDVILFSGDAYVDHPSFGAAVIGRMLEFEGLRVALVPQPNWQDDLRDFRKLGRPRMFFAVSAGNMDSMVNHYTANKRMRSDDAYSPDGRAHMRPDYATITYCNILKKLYPDVPVVIGGIEASLRRVTHYDYWSDKLMPSILIDSKADFLIYGMGEKPLKALLEELKNGKKFGEITDIPQTSFLSDKIPGDDNLQTIELVSHEECLKDKKKYASNFRYVEEESNRMNGARLVQKTRGKYLIINPMYPPWKPEELDATYRLTFTRLPHPKYKGKQIPAYEMIKFSVNLHRGCFGGCAFCTISAHQGKFIVSRSKQSILEEVRQIAQQPDFKGNLSDLGGPSANMYNLHGIDMKICEKCKRPSCIHPKVCPNLNINHSALTDIYRSVDKIPGIRHSYIGSGIRYDMLTAETKNAETTKSQLDYMRELVSKHVSGRLKVAPEHTSERVLKLMRKQSFQDFKKFKVLFDRINREEGLNQQLIPYFISSHPACMNEDMAELAAITKDLNFKLEQIQDFTPTPMTLATEIYYSGFNPYTLEPVFTAKSKDEKLEQRKFFFWYKKEYHQQIMRDLQKMNRQDLIKKLFQ
ncbi:MAG TPA: YgiQ family radical SAM protein [Paludibacteraceae bacterium]|nr:YgiQ family radical SAM protein [Paludibacteraceae bacterium]HPT43468.1 YgiQ family radical SAM protein [Paludibacteraceae bacterium]